MHAFLLALEVYSIVLEPDDADALYMQLGVGSSGKIRWAEFLKCFVGSGLQARQQERPGAISAPILGSCSKNAAHAPSEIDAYMRNAAESDPISHSGESSFPKSSSRLGVN